MGKNLIQQKRGKGGPRYLAPSHRYVGSTAHRPYDQIEKSGSINGRVVNILDCPGHSAPLVETQYENGERTLTLAPLGLNTKCVVKSGEKADNGLGNTLPLKNIIVGTDVFNIESKVGDGGKYIKAAGSSAKVIAKQENKVIVQFCSKKTKVFDENCRATIGIVAGGGRKDKPILKAGKAHFMMKARNKLYPKTSGVAMNAVNHPFGCGRGRHKGKPKTVGRNAPPGRKVGSIASRRTGIKR